MNLNNLINYISKETKHNKLCSLKMLINEEDNIRNKEIYKGNTNGFNTSYYYLATGHIIEKYKKDK